MGVFAPTVHGGDMRVHLKKFSIFFLGLRNYTLTHYNGLEQEVLFIIFL